MKFTLMTLALAIFVIPTRVLAGVPEPRTPNLEPLSMNDAVRLALAKHPTAMAAQQRVSAARYRLKSTSAFANPEVALTPFFGRFGLVGGSDDQIVLSQRFDLSGRQRIRTGLFGAKLAGAQADAATTLRDLVLDVKAAYIDLQLAREIVALNDTLVATAKQFRDAAQKQFDVGNVPRVQVDRAEIELARAEQELIRAQSAARVKEAELNTELGRDAMAPVALADKLEFRPLELNSAIALDDALKQRPEVRAAEAELRARKAQASLSGAERMPDLKIEGVRNTFRSDADYAVRVGFAFPLFDFGAIHHEVRAARADVREQEAVVTQSRNQVRLQVTSALARVQQARDLVVRYERDIVPRTQRLTETIQKGFNVGASTQLDVLDAQRTLRSVQTEYRQAIADYSKAIAELARATGAVP